MKNRSVHWVSADAVGTKQAVTNLCGRQTTNGRVPRQMLNR